MVHARRRRAFTFWKAVPSAKFLFVRERGARDDFQSALVTTTACWLAGKRLRYFPAAILSFRGKLGCAVWKFLEVALDKLSLLTASHRYRFHDDFQSSQLGPRWSNTCADCQPPLSFPWWLPVITTDTVWGIPGERPIRMQWLAVTTFMLTGSHRAPRSCTNKNFASHHQQNFYSYMSEEPDDFQSALVTTILYTDWLEIG